MPCIYFLCCEANFLKKKILVIKIYTIQTAFYLFFLDKIWKNELVLFSVYIPGLWIEIQYRFEFGSRPTSNIDSNFLNIDSNFLKNFDSNSIFYNFETNFS